MKETIIKYFKYQKDVNLQNNQKYNIPHRHKLLLNFRN